MEPGYRTPMAFHQGSETDGKWRRGTPSVPRTGPVIVEVKGSESLQGVKLSSGAGVGPRGVVGQSRYIGSGPGSPRKESSPRSGRLVTLPCFRTDRPLTSNRESPFHAKEGP